MRIPPRFFQPTSACLLLLSLTLVAVTDASTWAQDAFPARALRNPAAGHCGPGATNTGGRIAARADTPLTAEFGSGDPSAFISDIMAAQHIPGLSAAIIKEGQLYWSGAFGLADPTLGIPVTDDTLFMLASISKTLTATALMRLYDQQLFDLDDPINGYLPFTVTHPVHSSQDITFRMLLTHTSALDDNWGVMPYYPGDSPYPLGTYLFDYLTPAGALYDPNKNFKSWAPGDGYSYSNNALALVAHLTETISGTAFDDACDSGIFAPLGMNTAAWFLADLDPSQVAMPCSWNGTSYVPYGHFGYSDYPSGQLRTTAIELSRFLTMFIQDGQLDGATILDPVTAQQMKTPQVPALNSTQGLVWYSWNVGGRTVWGHNGGDQGVTTEMWFDPVSDIGVVVLTNGESYFTSIVDALFDYAEEQPPANSLTAKTSTVSAGAGSAVELTIQGGTVNAGRAYVVLGSISGTTPGTPLPGGAVVLPLQWDVITELIVDNINSPMFQGFYGTLSGQGLGRATFKTLGGLPTAAIGIELHLAAAFMGPWNYVSNPLTLQITP